MNLFKKTTATVALVALVSGIFSTGVAAYSSSEVEAANALAEKNYINDHSGDTAAYNLNSNVLRQEIAAVARGIAGLEKKESCDNSFSDVSATTPNTWACSSVEALLDAELIASNPKFNPEDNISKAEAVGMMVTAAFDGEYSFVEGNGTWQEQVVGFAVSNGVVNSFTNYDTPATRGFVFESGYNAMEANSEVVEEECDEISSMFGLCGDETTDDETTDDETTDDETTDDEVVISGDNVLTVELSADTPMGADLPKDANGVEVLSFDVTAGSEDVSITAMELERTGFGESAADEVAIYTEEGRASKVKSFSDSDDMANLTFSPAVVIKAGETRTLTAKVNTDASSIGEFAVSVKNITASSTVDSAEVVSNVFDVKNVDAAKLTLKDEGVNVSVKAGEEQADLAEFQLTNEGNLSTDVDITITSITLKEIESIDHEDVIENFTLTVNGDVISTVSSMEGKYLTFNFDAFVIEDDKNETFTVKADVMGGAGDKVQFTLDNVIDITAVASKYNAVNITNTDFSTASVDVDAGELTLYAIDAERDEIRQDKTNVVLGQLKVVNVAGQNLELQNLGVELTTTLSGVTQVLENVEFEVNGTSYDLSAAAGTTTASGTVIFSDTDLDIVLPQGTTIITVRADTLDDLTDGETVKMKLSAGNTSTFKVEETEEDEIVDDITPSSLTWDNVEVVLAAATIDNVTLGDLEIVKGATDLVALQFEIEAGDASYVTADKIKVTLKNHSGGITAITKTEVSEIALYQGSVSESNLLDKVSGSKLDTNGVATFDGFDVEIAADSTETFIVTVSTVDTDDVVGAQIVASIAAPGTDVSLEDDENDTVTLVSSALSDKVITILDSGDLALTGKTTLDDNEDAKVILAGTEAVIYSVLAKSTNEEVKAETVTFTLTGTIAGTGSFKNVITSAKLYLGTTVVATASNSDVTSASGNGTHSSTATITFDNISNLVFPTSDTELKLAIVTEEIGKTTVDVSRDGLAVSDIEVTNVVIADAEGDDSSEDVTATYSNVGTTSNLTDIVPVKVTPSVTNTFSVDDSSATITFAVDDGANTDASGSDLDVVLTKVNFTVTNFTSSGILTVKNSDNAVIGTGTVVAGDFTVTLSTTEVITSGEVINLSLSTAVDAEFDLKAEGIEFTVESSTYTTINDSAQAMGAYNKSN